MIVFIIFIIAIFIVIIFVKEKMEENQKAREEARKIAEEASRRVDQNREKRKLDIEDKKKRYYTKQLSKIYDKFSNKELMHIYDLLQRMHQNEVRDFFDDPNADAKSEIYHSTASELRRITGNSQWEHYYYNNEFGEFYSNSWDDPVAKWDMYYVYNLLSSRGIKNW